MFISEHFREAALLRSKDWQRFVCLQRNWIYNCAIISSSTVHNTIKRFRESAEVSVCKGQGQKSILVSRDRHTSSGAALRTGMIQPKSLHFSQCERLICFPCIRFFFQYISQQFRLQQPSCISTVY